MAFRLVLYFRGGARFRIPKLCAAHKVSQERYAELWVKCSAAEELYRFMEVLVGSGGVPYAVGSVDGEVVPIEDVIGNLELLEVLAVRDRELKGEVLAQCVASDLGDCMSLIKKAAVTRLRIETRHGVIHISFAEPVMLSLLFDHRLRLLRPFQAPKKLC